MRCVQECKKNILSRALNPQYARMGNSHWTPDIIASIWKQAGTGSIPVSGAGYRGRFVGPGFDRMWTDMSEIVRPTRDGIHGREYISTLIQIGRCPSVLAFDDEACLLTEMPPHVEIPVPAILTVPRRTFVSSSVCQSVIGAAGVLGTLAAVDFEMAVNAATDEKSHLIARVDPAQDDISLLRGIAAVEFPYSDEVMADVARVKDIDSEIIVLICLPLDAEASSRAVRLASSGAEALELRATDLGFGYGVRATDFVTDLVKEVHFALLDEGLRDCVTVLAGGGIATAEHIPKIVACGADGVALDLSLLVALECRLCPDCDERTTCPVSLDTVPVDSGIQRIVNLLGAWHSQLLEVMGAMGLREVRRLRGELGRTMSFEDLERDSFGPVFGDRVRSLEESLADESVRSARPPLPTWTFSGAAGKIEVVPSRYRIVGSRLIARRQISTSCAKVPCVTTKSKNALNL